MFPSHPTPSIVRKKGRKCLGRVNKLCQGGLRFKREKSPDSTYGQISMTQTKEITLFKLKSRRLSVIKLSTRRVKGNWKKEKSIFPSSVYVSLELEVQSQRCFLLLPFESMKKVSISDITFTRRLSSPHDSLRMLASYKQVERFHLNISVTKQRKSEWKDDIKKFLNNFVEKAKVCEVVYKKLFTVAFSFEYVYLKGWKRLSITSSGMAHKSFIHPSFKRERMIVIFINF